MSQPEYILEESEKTRLTEKQLACLIQELQDLEVDSVVLRKELTRLEGLSSRTANSLRELVQLLLEKELEG